MSIYDHGCYPGPLLTIAETARLLGVSVSTTRRLIRSGELPSVRVGRLVRVDRDDLMRVLRQPPTTKGRCR